MKSCDDKCFLIANKAQFVRMRTKSLAVVSCSDGLRLCFRIGGFESQIDGPAAQRTSTVTETARNCGHLAGGELDFTMLEFDHKPAFDNKKSFV